MVKRKLNQVSNEKKFPAYQSLLVGFLLCCVAILMGVVIILMNKLPEKAHQVNNQNIFDQTNNNQPTGEFIYSSDDLVFAEEQLHNQALDELNTNPSHPVAVMIDNHFEVWDTQFGLGSAKIVYHTLVEGGTTRFMAIFDTNQTDTIVGPVRSVRPYFISWALEYDALLAHVGGSPEALAVVEDLEVNDLNEMTAYGPNYFYRDDENYIAPHSTFTNLEYLGQALEDSDLTNYNHLALSHFNISSELPAENNTYQTISIDYSAGRTYDVEYKWNNIFQGYLSYRFDEVQRDAETGNIILINNLVIQRVPAEDVLDDKLRIAMDTLGEGEAIVFRNGEATPARWEKIDKYAPTKFFDLEGNLIVFNPGNVWIEIVPAGHEVGY